MYTPVKAAFVVAFTLFLSLIIACGDDSPKDTISVNRSSFLIDAEGSTATLIFQTSVASWRIQNTADWITLSETNGTTTSASITIEVTTKTPEVRADTLVIFSGDASQEVIVSQSASEFLYAIDVDRSFADFNRAGGDVSVTVETDAPEWTITSPADWISFSPATGGAGETTVVMTAVQNVDVDERESVVTVSAQYAPDASFDISQRGEYYPSYNTDPIDPDNTGMTSTMTQLAAKMTLGWNAGNSLEAIGGETAWGNAKITPELIDLVKASGFTAVRLPASWDQYMENPQTAQLKTSWLNRVKEVVQYCVDRDLYVVLNIHWDGGWLENNCTPEKEEENNAKQKAFWEQIATHLRGFDEHLLFASANEPNVENATQMAVLESYHQTFVDAVRSTGGRNSYRVLVVQGPSTDIQKAYELMDAFPNDELPNRIMAELHYYTPWNFCGLAEDATWGKMFYYWGENYHSDTDPDRNATWGEEADLLSLFAKVKSQFVDKGIPVILGEYGAMKRTNLTGDVLQLHLESRAYYHEYVTKQALAHGMIPFFWDNGAPELGTGIFNRSNLTIIDQQNLDALVRGAQ